MGRLLLPDAGPLFSFAAGDLLEVLLNFELVISDVVKIETIDRGKMATSSFESSRLAAFYGQYHDAIRIEPTQVGHLTGKHPKYHAGELSIQSMMIHAEKPDATILFEDLWFLRNRSSFPSSCMLISTLAFLSLLEESGMISSADQAEAKIRKRRPHFLAERWSIAGGATE